MIEALHAAEGCFGRLMVELVAEVRGPHASRFRETGRREFRQRLESLGARVMEGVGEKLPDVPAFDDAEGCSDRLFESLPVESSRFLRSFTDFRKAIHHSPLPPLESPVTVGPLPVSPRKDPGADVRSAFPFMGAESDALSHLHAYLSEPCRVHAYKQTRNGMLGVDYSSKFSPFLAAGVLSVRRIWFEVDAFERKHGASEGTEWLKFELLWREYFRWLEREQGTAFYSERGARNVDPLPSIEDQDLYQRWTRAETGEAFVDANLRELIATGYMSNRGRQNVASHFIHELRLPWLWGERFFFHMLIDADPVQNFGNWAYLAGVGADPRSFGGKPRKFDLIRQAETYDPDGSYRKTWGG